MDQRLWLRRVRDDDAEFLLQLYASTREDELARVPWSPDEKKRFIRMQFDLQQRHYQAHYPTARFDIIMWNDRPIGRLYTDRQADEIRIVDISLLPESRGRGFGGQLVTELLTEAAESNKLVRLSVLQNNRAVGLYRRLGFKKTGASGVHDEMEWKPSG